MTEIRFVTVNEDLMNGMFAIARSFQNMGNVATLASLHIHRLRNLLERQPDASVFHTWEAFGFDRGPFQFRARWFTNHGWPRILKDRQCWFLLAGPFEVSSHRGRIF